MSYFLRDRLLLDLSPCIERGEKKEKMERARERTNERKGGEPICERVKFVAQARDCHHD